ncbi:hypothetical protein ACCO45_012885 [Purpureocillium lilacinum]|uniref:Uncharacterized protein n=1 Tax=Purpureocillium lilacinum TaxID=33203 RepID=A0ACC4D980_PURLI
MRPGEEEGFHHLSGEGDRKSNRVAVVPPQRAGAEFWLPVIQWSKAPSSSAPPLGGRFGWCQKKEPWELPSPATRFFRSAAAQEKMGTGQEPPLPPLDDDGKNRSQQPQ